MSPVTDSNRGRLLMPHHAATASWCRRAAMALSLLTLISCSGSSTDDGGEDAVTTAVRVVAAAAVPVRGVQLDLRHDSGLTIMDVTPGASFAAASCAENVTDGRLQLGCVSGSDVVSPFTAWTIEMRHSSARDPEDGVTSLTCVVSDATGAHVAATCTLE